MLLSVIIVNYNSTAYLLRCLASLYKQAQGIDFETIVVDNASTDNGVALIARQFPQARLVKSETNLGFAVANNRGFALSSGENLLFLNPDTVILGTAVQTALGVLSRLGDAGAVGCTLLNSDSTIQTSAILRFPTILNQVLSADVLHRALPRLPLWGIAPLFAGSGTVQEVEAISGACMFVKRKAFEAAGMFDKRYFMYAEDVDLCYGIRVSGFKVYYTGDARIVHHGGKSTDRSDTRQLPVVMMKESTYTFLTKWKGSRYANAYKTALWWTAAVRCALLLLAYPLALAGGGAARVRWSLAKWTTVFQWAAGNPGIRQNLGRFCNDDA
jgi:hypothetical protein